MIHMGGRTYDIVIDYRNAYNFEAFRDRYSEVLERYDYIVGDWGYNQLRLKGFFKENNQKSTRDSSVASLSDYLNEYCNFGCAYFVLERTNVKAGAKPSSSGQDGEEDGQGQTLALDQESVASAQAEGLVRVQLPRHSGQSQRHGAQAQGQGQEATGKPGRQERHDRPERQDRPDRPERGDKPDKPERPDRPDRHERNGQARPDRPERQDRPDRPDQGQGGKPEHNGNNGNHNGNHSGNGKSNHQNRSHDRQGGRFNQHNNNSNNNSNNNQKQEQRKPEQA